jgi:hypothetical protein
MSDSLGDQGVMTWRPVAHGCAGTSAERYVTSRLAVMMCGGPSGRNGA